MSDQNLNQSKSEEITLNSRGYRLIKKLGEGSYANVYLTMYHPDQGVKVNLACKVIDTSRAPRDFTRKFLPRELKILIKLDHPHIVRIHSILQRRSRYYIFMRFAENGDLLDFILKNGIVLENQARVWLLQIALALRYLHSLEIAHRDLKCENILITANYNVKLADFGFARYVVDSQGRRVLSETYCGSLSYAAPEIIRGTPYSPKTSDLWSLGVVLYIMLNKIMPFDDTNIKKLYDYQINRKWRLRSKVESSLSHQAKNLIGILLEPDVTKRGTLTQIFNSEWMAMEPRLLRLIPAERSAPTTGENSLSDGNSRRASAKSSETRE